jgi:predicted chitinase
MSSENPNNSYISSIVNSVSKYVLDIKNTSVESTLRLMMTEFYKNDTLKNVKDFQGEIVRVVYDKKEFNFSPFNFINNVTNTNTLRYKVWIPDIGNILINKTPSDNNPQESIVIDLLPDFVVTDSSLTNLAVKDIVTVYFLDSVNFKNGIIKAKANKTSTGEAGSNNNSNIPSKPSKAFPTPVPVSINIPTGKPEAISNDRKKQAHFVVKALRKQGFTNVNFIAAVLANIEKETGWNIRSESSYRNTSPERLRVIFGDRLKKFSDDELKVLRADDVKFYDVIYGKDGPLGATFNNTNAGDGFKYRGRGYIGFTGRSLYTSASKHLYKDDRLVTNPDLANTPEVAADFLSYYFTVTINKTKTGFKYNENLKPEEAIPLVTSAVGGGLDVVKVASKQKFDKDNKPMKNIWKEILDKVTNFFPKYIDIAKEG